MKPLHGLLALFCCGAFLLGCGDLVIPTTAEDAVGTDGGHVEEDACTPQCAGKECGDDGCGGDCGPCPGAAPICNQGTCCDPECDGKECGDDGCGGSCGSCPGAAPICNQGTCCDPACDGKECGDDGCGGSCGSCPVAAPLCVEGTCCGPACDGKECGDDGCGGSCGTCPAAAPLCSEDGVCATCLPECETEECVPDGCGGFCGECPDPCDPNPCEQAPECKGAMLVTYSGVCSDNGGAAECSFEVESETACGDVNPGWVCLEGECVPGDACDPNPCEQAPNCAGNVATTYTGVCTDNAGVPECTFEVESETLCAEMGPDWVCVDGQCLAPAPCVPNPCSKPATCVDDVATSYTGVCTDVGGVAECSFEVAGETLCSGLGVGWFCYGGECAESASVCDYEFSGLASYVHHLAFGGVDDAPECCLDFDQDGDIDNAIGNLIGGIGGLIGGGLSANDSLLESIVNGFTTIVIDYQGLDDVTNDPAFTFAAFKGVVADPAIGLPYDPVPDMHYDTVMSVGEGAYITGEWAFVPGTAVPLSQDSDASIISGVLTAGPLEFELPVDFAGVPLMLAIEGATLEGAVAMHPNGKGLEIVDGMLGGYVPQAAFFDSVNEYIAGSCGCLGLDDGLVNYSLNPTAQPGSQELTASCNAGDDTLCDPTGDEICTMLNSYCTMMMIFLKADLDTDGNQLLDGMSIGLWLNATAGEILGIDMCMGISPVGP